MKHRDTQEVIVGGVLGPIERPDVVIAGRYRDEQLLIVGRTAPLTAEQSAALGAVLRPAGGRHPWPDEITSYRWGGKDTKKPLTKVRLIGQTQHMTGVEIWDHVNATLSAVMWPAVAGLAGWLLRKEIG